MKGAKAAPKSVKSSKGTITKGKAKRTDDAKTFCMCRADEEEKEISKTHFSLYGIKEELSDFMDKNRDRKFKSNMRKEVQSMSYLKAAIAGISGSAPVIMASLKAAVIREVKQTFRIELPDIDTAVFGNKICKRDSVPCRSGLCSSMASLKATVVRGIESALRVGVAGMGSLTMASLKAAVVGGVREVLAENGVKEPFVDALCMGIEEGIEKLGDDVGGGGQAVGEEKSSG